MQKLQKSLVLFEESKLEFVQKLNHPMKRPISSWAFISWIFHLTYDPFALFLSSAVFQVTLDYNAQFSMIPHEMLKVSENENDREKKTWIQRLKDDETRTSWWWWRCQVDFHFTSDCEDCLPFTCNSFSYHQQMTFVQMTWWDSKRW